MAKELTYKELAGKMTDIGNIDRGIRTVERTLRELNGKGHRGYILEGEKLEDVIADQEAILKALRDHREEVLLDLGTEIPLGITRSPTRGGKMRTKKEYTKLLARSFRRQDLLKLNNVIEFGELAVEAYMTQPRTCQLAMTVNEQLAVLKALRERGDWILRK